MRLPITERNYAVGCGGKTSHIDKLDTYTSFKCRFVMEDYLDTIANREHRVQSMKILISNYRLAIGTGRFSKTPRNDRLCLYC